MAAKVAFISLLAASALAQTTVTSVLLPDFDAQPLVASVVTAAPTGTWFYVQCGSDDSSDCGVGGVGMSLLEGSSTYQMLIAEPGVTISQGCQISGDTAACDISVGGTDADSPSTGVSTFSGLASMSLPITITAGLDKLSAGTGAATTTIPDIASSTKPTATAASSSEAGSLDPQTSTAAGSKTTGTSATGASASASKASSAAGSRATWEAGMMSVAALIGGMLVI